MKMFSKKWKASKKPSKQRKYFYNAPMHLKRKMIRSALSKELKQKLGYNSAPVRISDVVEVMKGSHKGKSGKITGFSSRNKSRVTIQGIEVTRRDGRKRGVAIHHSNIMITSLSEDRKRFKRASKPQPQSAKAPKAAEKKSDEKKSKAAESAENKKGK